MAKRRDPLRAASRTRSVPGSNAPARAARPRSRSAASNGTGYRFPTLPLGERQTENVSGELTCYGELRLGCTIRRRCFIAGTLLHRQRLNPLHNMVCLIGFDAGDSEQVLALQVNDIQEASIPGRFQSRQSSDRQIQLPQREVRNLVIRLSPTEQCSVGAALQPLPAAVQIDLPADELAGEPNVLAVLPDSQRQLVLIDDRGDDTTRRLAQDFRDLR